MTLNPFEMAGREEAEGREFIRLRGGSLRAVSEIRNVIDVDPLTGNTKTVTRTVALPLDCGHPVQHSHDARQCSICGAVICSKCANQCASNCSRILCRDHSWGSGAEKRCAWHWFLFTFFGIGKCDVEPPRPTMPPPGDRHVS